MTETNNKRYKDIKHIQRYVGGSAKKKNTARKGIEEVPNGERLVWTSESKPSAGCTEMVLGEYLREQPFEGDAMWLFGGQQPKQRQQGTRRTQGRSKPARFVQGTCKELRGQQQQEQWGQRYEGARTGNKTSPGGMYRSRRGLWLSLQVSREGPEQSRDSI